MISGNYVLDALCGLYSFSRLCLGNYILPRNPETEGSAAVQYQFSTFHWRIELQRLWRLYFFSLPSQRSTVPWAGSLSIAMLWW